MASYQAINTSTNPAERLEIPDGGGGNDETTALTAPTVNNRRKYVAEFFGTATFVQIGCGANLVGMLLVPSDRPETAWLCQRGVVWGLAAMLAIYMSAAQSGGHLNPAVSLSFALVRQDDFSLQNVLPYWIAQLAGAFVAGAIDLFLFTTVIANFEDARSEETSSETLLESASAFSNFWSLYGNVENGLHAAIVEAFGTGFLCMVIFAATNRKTCVPPSTVPVFVGAAYGLMFALFGSLTGAGMNPARDMGPRLVTLFGHWGRVSMKDWLPYFLGPLIGGPVGAFLADRVLLLQS